MILRKRLILIVALTFLLGVTIYTALYRGQHTLHTAVWRDAPYTFVIDAGHGGLDGGATSPTGLQESHLNLQIALQLEAFFNFYGYNTVMVRRDDISIYDNDANTIRQKKVSDLRNRAALVEATPNALLISIHQNTFGQTRYRGLQVFHANGVEDIAQALQSAVRKHLAPENDRDAKPVPNSVFLFGEIEAPALLIECGFLTNPQDEKLLSDPRYQRKLAACIFTMVTDS